MLREFRDFLLRGNIVELAVAFVIGTAFAALVGTLVQSLLMPLVAAVIGEPDFNGLTFTINEAVFSYGAFLTACVQFVAVAAAVFFFVVKPMQAIASRPGRTPDEAGLPDEERRHQELLAALRASS